MLMDRKTQYFKMSILSKEISINSTQYFSKFQWLIFLEMEKRNFQINMKWQESPGESKQF